MAQEIPGGGPRAPSKERIGSLAGRDGSAGSGGMVLARARPGTTWRRRGGVRGGDAHHRRRSRAHRQLCLRCPERSLHPGWPPGRGERAHRRDSRRPDRQDGDAGESRHARSLWLPARRRRDDGQGVFHASESHRASRDPGLLRIQRGHRRRRPGRSIRPAWRKNGLGQRAAPGSRPGGAECGPVQDQWDRHRVSRRRAAGSPVTN
jgi:hypothetical protein